MAENRKQIAVSGIQASGNLHIGNYIGAIKQFVELQDKYNMFVFVADLHAITVPQDPKKLGAQTLDAVYTYLACGLDPKKTTIFIQSHVPQHTELGWILNTITPLGELERMTQFKDKTKDQTSILAGLLNYPTLMAADILLYNPIAVPVGEDQVQHLELTRTLARKFNSRFGETFKEPKALIQKDGARIMALDDPIKKMSKSGNANNFIGLLDSEAEIRRKIKIAVTDSGKEIKYDPATKPAISNLLIIYSQMAGLDIKEIEKKYVGKSYSEFKADLAEVVLRALKPIQEKYNKFAKDKKSVLQILRDGAAEARKVAETTMEGVRAKVGFLEALQ
ncbi:MAG: tryptophan--tRNA ligase [bacterium]|nr:tryptophan--tRNA ligase [bacterium]